MDRLDDKDFDDDGLQPNTSDGGGCSINADVSEVHRVAGSPTMKMKEDYSAAFQQASEHSGNCEIYVYSYFFQVFKYGVKMLNFMMFTCDGELNSVLLI